MSFLELTEMLGNLGEFLGSLAVFATLIYLAVQIRHSRELLERNERIALSQVHQARTDTRVGLQLALISPEHIGAISKLWGSPELVGSLNEEEWRSAQTYMVATMVVQDNALYQAGLGLLDEDVLNSAVQIVSNNWRLWEELEIPVTPRVRECYESSENSSSTEADA